MCWTRNAAIAATTLAAAMPVAACGSGDGGGDADSFKEDYNAISKDIQKAGKDLSASDADTPKELAGQIDKIADKFDDTRAKLADLEPPDDAQDELDQLVTEVGKGVDAMRNVADAARDGDFSALKKASQEVQQTGSEIAKAEDKLKSAVDG